MFKLLAKSVLTRITTYIAIENIKLIEISLDTGKPEESDWMGTIPLSISPAKEQRLHCCVPV